MCYTIVMNEIYYFDLKPLAIEEKKPLKKSRTHYRRDSYQRRLDIIRRRHQFSFGF